MRYAKFFVLAVGMAVLVVWSANGQPPPGGFKGLKGPKGAKAANTNSEQLLDDLKLTDAQRTKARDILRAHDDKMRQAARQARQDLIAQMKDVLDESEYKVFKEELDQVPLLPTIPQILRTVSTDDLIARLMSFDKNGDGKITRDELPERMHALIEQGDLNGDGALDRDEIRRLAERPRQGGPKGFPPGFPPGGPPGGFPPPKRP
jgi:hypothetical protein